MKTTQEHMAKHLGITQAYLCQIFNGVKPVSYKLAYKWSKVFGQSMDWWLNATPAQIKNYLFKQFQEDGSCQEEKK